MLSTEKYDFSTLLKAISEKYITRTSYILLKLYNQMRNWIIVEAVQCTYMHSLIWNANSRDEKQSSHYWFNFWIILIAPTGVDHCALSDHGCEHLCVNGDRSYTCQCFEGYRLRNDGKTCKRKLLFSNSESNITHIEEICKVGLDCLNVAVQCNFKCSRISRGHISSLLSYLPAVCQYLGYARPSKMVLNAYF